MDELDRRRAFMRLSEKDRFERLFEMIVYASANQAVASKLLADLRTDFDYLKGEVEGIGYRKRDTLDTDEKIHRQLEQQNAGWIWYKEKVLPGTLSTVQTLIVLAVLYFVFGGKIP
jgi:hypothetical protein